MTRHRQSCRRVFSSGPGPRHDAVRENRQAEIKTASERQSRVDWWRAQFQRLRKANLSVSDVLPVRLGADVTTFSYGKKRVDEAPPEACGQVPAVRPSSVPSR